MINKLVDPDHKKQPKRPEMLRLLCILTFLGSGLSVISYFFIFIFHDTFLIQSEEIINEYPDLGKFLGGGKRYFLTGFLLYSISLYGAIKMWDLKKIGFHLYTAAQILIFILPVFLPSSVPFSMLPLLITFIFILGYAMNLKFMK